MRRSYYEIYIHAIWRTKNSEPMINSNVILHIQNIAIAKCQKFDLQLIAIGNTEDHIHVLLLINPNVRLSEFIAEVKGATSYFINQQTKDSIYWQDGYGAVSVSKSALNTVKRYVENQKEHHQLRKNIEPTLELAGES